MRPQAFLLVLYVAAQTANAALIVRPGPTALGASAVGGASAASFSASAPQWTSAFDSFLQATAPDAAAVRGIARALAAVNPEDPAVKAQLAPFALSLQKAVAMILQKPVHAKSTRADLEAADLKFEVLNYPAVRVLLKEDQQSQH